MIIIYVFLDYDGTLSKTNDKEFSDIYFKHLSKFLDVDYYMLKKEIINVIKEIIKNTDIIKSNYEKFLFLMNDKFGYNEKQWEKIFFNFYNEEFIKIKEKIVPNIKLIEYFLSSNHKLIFASNPLFPEIAVKKRIEMIKMKPEDFFYISTMENSNFTKPHKSYFDDILFKNNLNPMQCVMIGDTDYDKACEKSNIKFIHVSDEKSWLQI